MSKHTKNNQKSQENDDVIIDVIYCKEESVVES